MARSDRDVRTFSVTFNEASYDESEFSQWVAERFKTRHTEVQLRKEDFLKWLPDALAAIDQPTFDGLNTYYVARSARESGLTVAISGLGGDEVFGGYPFFNPVPWISRLARFGHAILSPMTYLITMWISKKSSGVSGLWKIFELFSDIQHRPASMPILAGYQIAQLQYPHWIRQKLLADGLDMNLFDTWFGIPTEFLTFIEDERVDHQDLAGQLSHVALRLFLGERCLRDTDMMSMGVSLEVRAPFTDHHFIETMWKIPGQLRCHGAPDKPFEWKIVRPYLTVEYPLRKKQGFIYPFEEWMHDKELLELMQMILLNKRLAENVGLRPATIQGLLESFSQGGTAIPWSRIWNLFVLLWWCEQHRVRL